MYVVTLSSQQFSRAVLESLGIQDLLTTKLVIHESPEFNKLNIYKQICKKEKVKYKECLIIGDNYKIDLKEAHDEGFFNHTY